MFPYDDPSVMPEWKLIWIEDLIVSDAVRRKIEIKHGIDVDWIIDQLARRPSIYGAKTNHKRHGKRTLINISRDSKLTIAVFLIPSQKNYGEWFLKTSFTTMKRSKFRGESNYEN